MEYPLLSLKSILDTWLSFSSTSWGSAIVTGILCGLGLFLLSLHFHPSDLYSPPPRNIRKNKPQSLIRTEIRHPERPTLQKQLERQRALSSGVKRPQEVCSVPISTHPEDSRVAAMLPENFPISSEMRKVLEQHLQERFIHPLWELPGKIRKTLERVRLQGELPAKSQTQKPHRPSRTIRFPHESSPDAQKVELWCSQHLGRGPRGFMGRVPEDLSRGSGSPLMRLQAPQYVGVTTPMGNSKPQYVGVVTAMGNSKPESVGFATPVGNFKPQSVRVATPMGNSKPQYVGVATTMGNAKLQYMSVATSTGSLATESQGK
ncbi:Spermatogenesis-Associated Protein 31C2-Like [Manis pentadactyla]|nr:Spermatogenesis-Associated Protein 31C2-Like [Manis pentadactyla]